MKANLPAQQYPEAFLEAIPKSDLHLHLDGSLRLPTLIELARERGVELPSNTPEGLLELVFKESYRDLPDYLHGFAYTCAVMTDAEALERVAYELAQDCLAEGVRYIEVRFAPQLHVRPGFDVGQVIAAVDRGLARARQEHEASPAVAERGEPPFRYGIITCAMRMFTGGFGPYYKDLVNVLQGWPPRQIYGVASLSLARAVIDARDRLGLPIVGFDLAGAEAGHPASDHVRAFRYAHQHFLKKTVHAGEAYGPESIFQAITKLNADRIGHGTHLYSVELVQDEANAERYVEQLAEYISHRRVTLEVCITSNLQTMPFLDNDARRHPFGRMLRERLSVALCTDNRLVSRTTVTREIAQASAAFGLTPGELRTVAIHGFKRSFFPGTYREKRAYVRQVIDHYDQIAERHGFSVMKDRVADDE
ncbi:MAG TPA: adenosine deaminase family protein [Thermoanaerobaculia bacterium]|nr:adenosine deaminase family protein [Thermoanaerobaculia bacterium]